MLHVLLFLGQISMGMLSFWLCCIGVLLSGLSVYIMQYIPRYHNCCYLLRQTTSQLLPEHDMYIVLHVFALTILIAENEYINSECVRCYSVSLD